MSWSLKDKEDLAELVRFGVYRRAMEIALAKIQVETDNRIRDIAPLTNPSSVEVALRAQGALSGVLRLTEILQELTETHDE